MIEDTDDLLEQVHRAMGVAYDLLTTDGANQAAETMLNELRWTLPQSDQTQCYWMIERTRRHALYTIVIEQAHKFHYKQINLQQRFDHYFKLIESADKSFNTFIDANPSLFPNSGDNSMAGGFYIPAGFVYDQLGRDLTYEQD